MDLQFILNYADNGRWYDNKKSNGGFGLDLIQILTEQLNGTFQMKTGDDGTNYKFVLSKLT